MRFGAVLVLGLVAGCSTPIKVRAKQHPSASFEGLRTYGWVERPESGDPRLDDDALDGRVRAAVAEELAAKGWTPSGTPDLRFRYQVVLRDETRVSEFEDVDSVWDKDYVPRIDPSRDPATFERVYTVGTLVLDASSPASGTVLWRASADTDIDLRSRSKKRDEIVREAVRLMFGDFPAAK